MDQCSVAVVSQIKHSENKASNHAFGNAFLVDVMIHAWKRKFVYAW